MSAVDWNDRLKADGKLPDPWACAEPMPKPAPAEVKADPQLDSFFLGRIFSAVGWVGHKLRPGLWAVRCPAESFLHKQGERFDGSTRLAAPDAKHPDGEFICTHPMCAGAFRHIGELGNAIQRVASSEGL
jgi:hypothetical protein